jgi:hypothetical protein
MYIAVESYGCCKVDRDVPHVAYVAIVFQRHVVIVCFECFGCFSGMFHLCFPDACCNYVYLDVVYVSHICCMCFIRMLRMGCNGFQVCFRCVF